MGSGACHNMSSSEILFSVAIVIPNARIDVKFVWSPCLMRICFFIVLIYRQHISVYVWEAELCFTSTRMLWFAEAEDSVSYSAFVIHKCAVQHDSRFTMEEVSPTEDHVNVPSDSKVWKRSFLHLRLRVRNSLCEYLVIKSEKI